MFEFKTVYHPQGDIAHIETHLTGNDLLCTPKLNKGTAFSEEERTTFGLTGLLPNQVETLEQQVERMYAQYHEHTTHLSKHIYLNVLHDYNETLFYKLTHDHLEETLPILYTPTIGEAVKRFSLEYRKARGLYISYPNRHLMDVILEHRLPPAVDLAVITDGQAVLGIGDQGIGGINIASAKLMVYTLCGGINPNRVLPIQLDVGTDNPSLLNDPLYLGWRHERIKGSAYDEFIDTFIQAITKKFPNILLHWEDLGRDNARNILHHYRDKICTFNDDMQGTAVVSSACILAGIKASGLPNLRDHRIVILGAGNAGIGIADHLADLMRRAGLSEAEQRERLWILDRSGLLTTGKKLSSFQTRYAHAPETLTTWTRRDPNETTLFDVVSNIKPTILIGCSTAAGAFTEEIVTRMASQVSRPIIMPLSNPNELSEATPADLFRWTAGKAIIATGSPFPDVHDGVHYHRIAQSNNAFVFPGIGLGTIIAKAKHVTDNMLIKATETLTACSPINQDMMAPLLPKLSEAKMVSASIALAVAEEARKEGIAGISKDANLKELIKNTMWEPRYYPYKKI
jgi:malate dehydrogenase (oxaloacetate-decarboxylating)